MPEAIPVIGPIVGGLFGMGASENAADAQVGAANAAAGVQRQMFNQTQENLSPFMNTGKFALSDLEYLLGMGMGRGDFLSAYPEKFGSLARPFSMSDFQASPGYQFNLQEGQKAIEKAARRSGKAYAPSTLQEIGRFSQGVASNEFNNERNAFRNFQNDLFNRVSGVSGSGQNAAANLGAFAGQAGNAIGNSITGAGNAAAAGMVGGANALSGGLAGAYNNYLTDRILREAQRPTYTGGGSDPYQGWMEWGD